MAHLASLADFVCVSWLAQYMTECTFNWRMMKTIFTQLHVYDKEKNYVPFDHQEEREDPFLAIQRRALPA